MIVNSKSFLVHSFDRSLVRGPCRSMMTKRHTRAVMVALLQRLLDHLLDALLQRVRYLQVIALELLEPESPGINR
jgi:hypothetical protein